MVRRNARPGPLRIARRSSTPGSRLPRRALDLYSQIIPAPDLKQLLTKALEEGAILALGFLAQQGWRRLRNLGQARLDSGRS